MVGPAPSRGFTYPQARSGRRQAAVNGRQLARDARTGVRIDVRPKSRASVMQRDGNGRVPLEPQPCARPQRGCYSEGTARCTHDGCER